MSLESTLVILNREMQSFSPATPEDEVLTEILSGFLERIEGEIIFL